MKRARRSGFSLIEALVVLAIGGMALAIIFSIGTKAGDTGFGLGRRAMDAADSDVAVTDLRSIIRSLALRPTDTFQTEFDQPILGEATRLVGDVVMERATQCAPQGWAGRLTLAVETRGTGRVLTCSAGERQATLATLRTNEAAFSYSADGGLTWSPGYTNAPQGPQNFGEPRSQALWVRFAAGAALDVTEGVSSGRPETWMRGDGDL
jgi:prepilin-type N-terminal cleavage/methylation domain-containing protein